MKSLLTCALFSKSALHLLYNKFISGFLSIYFVQSKAERYFVIVYLTFHSNSIPKYLSLLKTIDENNYSLIHGSKSIHGSIFKFYPKFV